MKRFKNYWQSRSSKRVRIIGLVIIASLLLARYTTWIVVENANKHTAAGRFDTATSTETQTVKNRLEVYADTLYSAQAFMTTEKSISAQEWSYFTGAQNLDQRYPYISGLAYVKAADDGRSANLAYLAPLGGTYQSYIGYALMTDPTRARLLDSARDSGLIRAYAPLELAGPTDASGSLLMVQPVYDSAATPRSIAERRSSIMGYVALSVRLRPLLGTLLVSPEPQEPLATTVSADGHTLYESGGTIDGLKKTMHVDVAGQDWRFDFSARSTYGLSRTDRSAPRIVLWSSIPFTLVLIVVFYYAISWHDERKKPGNTAEADGAGRPGPDPGF